MLDKNLHSLNKLQEEIKATKLFSCLLPKEQRAKIKEIDDQLSHMTHLIESFNRIFSDSGWCSYDSMNMPLMEKAISDYEKDGIEATYHI